MKETLRRPLVFLALISAMIGVIILLSGISTSVRAHSQLNSEGYSFANHFVSELGWHERSPKADYFNWSLGIFFILSLPLITILGFQIRTPLGVAATVCGVYMLLAGVAVAIFPMDHPQLPTTKAHLRAASAFFPAFLVTMALFTAAFLSHKEKAVRTLMVFAGLVCIVFALSFLLIPKDSIGRLMKNIEQFQRPQIWWLAAVEWGILGSGLLWGMAAAAVLGFQTFPLRTPTASKSAT